MNIDVIIKQIEEITIYYRDAKMYGEVFGLKVALELIKKAQKAQSE